MDAMRLYQDPRHGTWGVRWSRTERPPNGKWVSLRRFAGHTITDKEEAERWFASVKKQWLNQKLVELERGRSISIEKLSESFTQDPSRSDLSGGTLRNDKAALRYLGESLGKTKDIGTITKKDLGRFKAECLARGCSPFTVRSYFRHVRSALNWAQEQGYIRKVPTIPSVKAPKRLPRVIEPQHRVKLETWALEKDRRIWRYMRFSLWTGCRLSECIGLRWEQVELYDEPQDGTVGRCTVIGKGDKQRAVYLLAPALEAMGAPKEAGPVFDQAHPDTVSHWFHDAVVGCKLAAKRYNFHSCRHTAATMMFEVGMSAQVVQKILGHEDLETTMVYIEVRDAMVQKAMGKLVRGVSSE